MAQRRNVNEFLQISCSFPDTFRDAVKSAADFSDGFWWSANLDPRHSASDVSSGYKSENVAQAPPSLCALASSWYAQDTAYDIFQLLRLSGTLSVSRQAEEAAYPLLYSAKLLLREVTFYGILHPDPVVRIGSSFNLQTPPETIDLEEHARLLHECLTRFLQHFESACSVKPNRQPREILAGILAVCIFSAARTLLLDMSPGSTQSSGSSFAQSSASPFANSSQAVHSIYKSLVQLFMSSNPPTLDNWERQVEGEDASLYYNTSRLVRRDMWAAEGPSRTADFLLRLGDGYVEGVGFCGFLRQRRPNNLTRHISSAPLLRAVREPSRRQEHAPAPPSPSGLTAWRAGFQDDVRMMPRRTSDIERMAHHPDTERLRRHTMGGAPSFALQLDPPSWGQSTSPTRFKPPNQRAPLRRVYCDRCNEYPEGFRGEHELRRHTDAKHSTLVRRWICCEPENSKDTTPKPVVPLAGCKACMTQKQYGAYYNAAAHLRRAHFSPHRGSKASGDWPPMAVLKDWMREVRQQQNQGQPDRPGREDMVAEPRPSEPWSQVARTAADSSSSRASIASPIDDIWRQRDGFGLTSRPSSGPPDNRSQCPHPDCGRVVKDLAAHMLTHQEERPEKCPIVTCEYHIKGFARKYDKNRHALTHYRGALSCPFCPGTGTPFEKVFGRADIFKRHLATEHNVDQSATTPLGDAASHYDPHGPAALGGGNTLTARCSICNNMFAGPQDFYEHLDDCVLQVIVPAASQVDARPPDRSPGSLPRHGGPRTAL